MSELPPEVVEIIEREEGFWSDEAEAHRLRLRLTWDDVIAVAQTSETWKRSRDKRAGSDQKPRKVYVDAVIGRDTCGRRLYMAGKIIRYDDETIWKVITIHEAAD